MSLIQKHRWLMLLRFIALLSFMLSIPWLLDKTRDPWISLLYLGLIAVIYVPFIIWSLLADEQLRKKLSKGP